MSGAQKMTSVRRRMPGMASQRSTADPQDSPRQIVAATPPATTPVATAAVAAAQVDGEHAESAGAQPGPTAPVGTETATGTKPSRRPPVDYASTRLVNFRIPVELHDRYRALVRDAEANHPRLRKPSLTELVIALLAEGPGSADEVAELIRRKRAREHAEI